MAYLRARTRLCALPAVAAIALATWPTVPVYAAEQYNLSVIGKWRLADVLDSSDIVAIGEDEAQRLVGQVLTISSDKVQLGNRVCAAPGFEASQEDPRTHLEAAAHASADKLGLPNPVTVVHVSCTYVLIRNPNSLVVYWKGYFFDAVRVQATKKGSSIRRSPSAFGRPGRA